MSTTQPPLRNYKPTTDELTGAIHEIMTASPNSQNSTSQVYDTLQAKYPTWNVPPRRAAKFSKRISSSSKTTTTNNLQDDQASVSSSSSRRSLRNLLFSSSSSKQNDASSVASSSQAESSDASSVFSKGGSLRRFLSKNKSSTAGATTTAAGAGDDQSSVSSNLSQSSRSSSRRRRLFGRASKKETTTTTTTTTNDDNDNNPLVLATPSSLLKPTPSLDEDDDVLLPEPKLLDSPLQKAAVTENDNHHKDESIIDESLDVTRGAVLLPSLTPTPTQTPPSPPPETSLQTQGDDNAQPTESGDDKQTEHTNQQPTTLSSTLSWVVVEKEDIPNQPTPPPTPETPGPSLAGAAQLHASLLMLDTLTQSQAPTRNTQPHDENKEEEEEEPSEHEPLQNGLHLFDTFQKAPDVRQEPTVIASHLLQPKLPDFEGPPEDSQLHAGLHLLDTLQQPAHDDNESSPEEAGEYEQEISNLVEKYRATQPLPSPPKKDEEEPKVWPIPDSVKDLLEDRPRTLSTFVASTDDQDEDVTDPKSHTDPDTRLEEGLTLFQCLSGEDDKEVEQHLHKGLALFESFASSDKDTKDPNNLEESLDLLDRTTREIDLAQVRELYMDDNDGTTSKCWECQNSCVLL